MKPETLTRVRELLEPLAKGSGGIYGFARAAEMALSLLEESADARQVPDGVWEALQRLIENAGTLGSASMEDAKLVSRYRDRLLAAAPKPAVNEPPADPLRDALDHIARVARGSRTGTRRLQWIAQRAQSAIDGDHAWRDLPTPKIDTRCEFRSGQRVRLTLVNTFLGLEAGTEHVVDHVQPPVPARQGRVWINRAGGGSGFALNFDEIEVVPEQGT